MIRIVTAALLLGVAVVTATWPVFSRPLQGIYDPSSRADFPPRFAAFLAGEPIPDGAPPDPPEGARDILYRFDPLLNVWTLAWGAHAVATAPARFFDSNAVYPARRALSYSDHQLGVLPWFAPWYWITGNPVLAYQAALFLGAIACGLFFALLVQSWTGRTSAGIVAGIVSVVAPFHLSYLRVLIHFTIQYLPAAFVCVDMLVTGRRRRLAAGALVATVALQASCSVYMVYTTALAVGLYALAVLIAEPRAERVRACGWLAGCFVVAGLLVMAAYQPHLEHARAEWQNAAAAPYNPILSRQWADAAVVAIPRMLTQSLGIPLLAVALLGCLESRSRRRLPAVTLVVAGVLLGLGPTLRIGSLVLEPMPWAWLARLLPGFDLQRHAYVPTILVGVGLVCLVGLGWSWLEARLERRGRLARAAGLALALLVVAEPIVRSWREPRHVLRLATGDRVPAVYRWLASHGRGEPLLEWPIGAFGPAYQYFSTHHWLPLFNGYYALPPPGRLGLEVEARHVLDPVRGGRFLDEVGITWVIVHDALLGPAERANAERPLPHLELIERFGNDRLFRVRVRPGT